MAGAFYGQLLQIYSLLIAAVIAIASRELSRLHANFVLFAVSSPLSIYIVTHAFVRTVSRKDTRLKPVFGYEDILDAKEGRFLSPGWKARLNRASVLILVPVWIIILAITLKKKGWFIQETCGLRAFHGRLVGELLMVPALFIVSRTPGSTEGNRSILFGSHRRLGHCHNQEKDLWFKRGDVDTKEPWGVWRKTTTPIPIPYVQHCHFVSIRPMDRRVGEQRPNLERIG